MTTETITVSAIEVPVSALNYLRPYAREAGFSVTKASIVRFAVCRLAERLGKPIVGVNHDVAVVSPDGE